MRLIPHSGEPFTLRLLNEQAPLLEDGLRFRDALLRPAPVAARSQGRGEEGREEKVGVVTVGVITTRLFFASQLLVVLLLVTLVFSVVFIGVRASSSVSYYYAESRPYLQELRDRGMNMLRNADESSASMAHLMLEADGMASSAAPALARSVNETTAAIDRLAQLARNPVVKLSVE